MTAVGVRGWDVGGYEAQEGTTPQGSPNAKPALSLYIRITRILTHVPPKLNPQIREWRTDRIIVRSLPWGESARLNVSSVYLHTDS